MVYHEKWDELSAHARDIHRALESLKEEIEAVDWYHQRVDLARDDELRPVATLRTERHSFVLWPLEEDAALAAAILARRATPEEKAAFEADYAERLLNPYVAAERGFVDEVIDPDALTVLAAACRDREEARFDYRRHDGDDTRRARAKLVRCPRRRRGAADPARPRVASGVAVGAGDGAGLGVHEPVLRAGAAAAVRHRWLAGERRRLQIRAGLQKPNN